MPENKQEKKNFFFKKPVFRKRKDTIQNPFVLKYVRDERFAPVDISEFKKKITDFDNYQKKLIEKEKIVLSPAIEDVFDVTDLIVPSNEQVVRQNLDKKSNIIVAQDTFKEEMYKRAFECRMPSLEELKKCHDPVRESYNLDSEYDEYIRKKDKNNRITARDAQLKQRRDMMQKDPLKVDKNEVLLKVFVHNKNDSSPYMEILVLGSSPLKDLRKAIVCQNYSSTKGSAMLSFPSAKVEEIEEKNQGFFFVENTFYDYDEGCDYSRYSDAIINWSRSESRANSSLLGPYEQKSMQDFLFEDLKVKVDAVYLYRHKGSCDHFITFKEIRRINPSDNNNEISYPITTYLRKEKFTLCEVCEKKYAHYVTYGDKLAKHQPFFYCQHCFKMLHPNPNEEQDSQDYEVYLCNIEH